MYLLPRVVRTEQNHSPDEVWNTLYRRSWPSEIPTARSVDEAHAVAVKTAGLGGHNSSACLTTSERDGDLSSIVISNTKTRTWPLERVASNPTGSVERKGGHLICLRPLMVYWDLGDQIHTLGKLKLLLAFSSSPIRIHRNLGRRAVSINPMSAVRLLAISQCKK